jgi:hypothetical protein
MKHAPRPPSKRPRYALAGVALLAVAFGGGLAAAVQGKGDTLTVTRQAAKLRNAKRTFAPAVADLVEGDRLVVEAVDGAWFSATYTASAGPVTGFVHKGDVSTKKDVRLSGDGVRENYSSSEAAAARKGFNPQVEREHRANNPGLETAFQAIDALQALEVTESEVFAFLVEGGLVNGSDATGGGR